MASTIYASFDDSTLAERAAGALLDHGVQGEHISLVRKDGQTTTSSSDGGQETTSTPFTSGAIVGGPGAISSMGSGIQPAGSYTGPEAPPSTGFGTFPSAGYDEEDVNATARSENYGGSGERIDGETTAGENSGDTAPSQRDNGDPEETAKHGISTTTPADAGAGAVKGAGFGLGVGIVAALVSLMVPGIGLVVGGGALATALAGLAATAGAGAAAGAVYGYLKDQGVDEPLARKHAETLENGGALLAIQFPSGSVGEDEIRQILSKYGAENLCSVGTGGYVA